MDCIEEGIVTEVLGSGVAIVQATRAEACAKCSSKGACSAIGGASATTTVEVRNELGARVGDRVAVRLAGEAVVSAAGLLYFLPALALIGGAGLGHLLAGRAGMNVDLGAALGAGAGLLLSLGGVGLFGRRLGRRERFVPRISEILLRPRATEAPPPQD